MSRRLFATLAIVVSVGLAMAVSPLASSSPDGLERVAQEEGFAGAGRVTAVQEAAPAPGYALPGVGDERLATGLAGAAGTLVVLALGSALAHVLRRRPAEAP